MDHAVIRPVDGRSDEARSPASAWAFSSGGQVEAPARLATSPRALPGERGRALDIPPLPADGRLGAGWRHNLPQPLTSFIGRESELAEATRLLGETRLLTLTGAGGVGKTRLGQEVATGLLDAFADGVWIAELAAVVDPGLVPQALAAVLGVREESSRPLTTTLTERLYPQRLLLVLDNCEHLIDAVAVLADTLLRACPWLHILATSRQALGIAGEMTLPVPSLALEPLDPCPASALSAGSHEQPGYPERSGTLDLVSMPEAVRLFVERARAVVPAFTLTDRNRRSVEQICQRLDGIPLAIELAAARVAALGPEQIAARLVDRFRLLSGGSRTALPRHRTLRALIDWSHDLLSEPERVVLRRLSVFVGGWSLEAAEAVCAGDGLASDEILDLLSGLVTKSLVQVSPAAEDVRYRFLETLREYADEKLRASDEETCVRARHRDWFVAFAERAAPELTGPDQETWLKRLDRERENLRAAQQRTVATGDAEMLARLGAALWQYWWARADATDARELVAAIVPLARAAAPTSALARALHGAGLVAGSLGEYATCRLLLSGGLDVVRHIDDRRTLAILLDSIGRQSFVEGRNAEARPLLDEAVAIFREIGDRQGLARALSHLGFLVYLENDQESARAAYREGLALARDAGDRGAVAEFLDNLGRTFQADGDLDSAARAFHEAVAIWRETGQGHWLAMALNNLGSVQVLRGELRAARAQLAEALQLAQRMGNRRRLAFALSTVAMLAAVEGEADRAVRLESAATAAVTAMGARLSQPTSAAATPYFARARRTLGLDGTASAVAMGQAMTLASAVDEALGWLAEPETPAEPGMPPARERRQRSTGVPPILAAVPPSSGTIGLSPRELEVAALVARGLTNRQIAAELVITEGTAANHVKHILAKLVLDSRAQIAVWAVEHGLHRSVLPQPLRAETRVS